MHGGCNTRPNYGKSPFPPTSCTKHKQKGMIFKPSKRCNNCNETGIFEKRQIRYCEIHKPDNAINLALKDCLNCCLPDILNESNLCKTCDPSIIEKVLHAKENTIKDVLNYNKINYISHDKTIDNGSCGKERPDFIIDATTHIICLEIDEHQHQNYACVCEQTRMINISQSLGMPTIFIRYNPDKYKSVNQAMNTKRHEILINWIKHLEKEPPDVYCKALYLFYDEYREDIPEFKTILEFEK